VSLFEGYDPHFHILHAYDDIEAALRNIEVFSSDQGQGPRYTPPSGMVCDPPLHSLHRGLVQQAFTPGAIRAMTPRVEALTAELLDAVNGRETFDIHDDIAFPLPVVIISQMLGVPGEDIERFKQWSDASVEAMGAEDPTPWMGELEALQRYLLDQIRARRAMAAPPDDLISRMVGAKSDGQGLSDEAILGLVSQLLVGGNETTTSLITNVVWRLLEERSLWERVVVRNSARTRGRRSLAGGARRGREPALRSARSGAVPHDDARDGGPRRGDPQGGEGHAALRGRQSRSRGVRGSRSLPPRPPAAPAPFLRHRRTRLYRRGDGAAGGAHGPARARHPLCGSFADRPRRTDQAVLSMGSSAPAGPAKPGDLSESGPSRRGAHPGLANSLP
jgi:hypothetical protein